MTRWDAHKFARDAYNAGIRFIGGCCGIEPYHIRAVAEEVSFLYWNLESMFKGKQYHASHVFQCDFAVYEFMLFLICVRTFSLTIP